MKRKRNTCLDCGSADLAFDTVSSIVEIVSSDSKSYADRIESIGRSRTETIDRYGRLPRDLKKNK